MMNEPISSVMVTNLITVKPNDKLSRVREILSSNRIHHVPVEEDKRLVGLITTSDLLYLNKLFQDYDGILVKDVMCKKLATLSPSDKIGSAAEIFLENRFHCLPIIDNNKLVGIITSFDVIKYSFKKEYPNDRATIVDV